MPFQWMFRCVLSGALVLLQALPAVAGFPGRTVFRGYGIEEGLGSLAINALAQDREGFLWIGTDLGLYRFDGTRFLHLGRAEGLPADIVTSLWADPSGGVWVSCAQGARRVVGLQVLGAGEGLPEGPFFGMARDGDGRLWVAKGRQGLFRETSRGRFERIPAWSRAWVVAWAPQTGGMVVAGPEGRMELWRGGEAAQSWSLRDGLGREPHGVTEDGEGRLWVLDGQGLFVKDPHGNRFRRVEHPVVRSGGLNRSLAPDGRGGFWVATVHGLLRVGKGLLEPLTEQEGLPAHGATAVLQDREGSLWCGSGGLFRQLGLGAWVNHTTAQGLPSELVWRFERDAQGRLWAGTDRGLACWEGQRWRSLPETADFTAQSLLPLPGGGLLAAGTSSRLLHVGSGQRRATPYPGPDKPGESGGLRLFADGKGGFWALGAALHRLEMTASGPRFVDRIPLPEASGVSDFLGVTDDGRLWFVGLAGLVEWHQGRWQHWGQRDGLRSDAVGSMAAAPDGTLWITYQNAMGLTRARRTAVGLEVLGHLTAARGELPTDGVFSAHPDPETGALWLLTNLGVVHLEQGRCELFGRPAGLLNPDMVQGAFHASPDGLRWFGTSGGVAIFDPAALSGRTPLLPPVVSDLRVGGRRVEGMGVGVRIPPGASSVDLLLGSLSYSRERALRYQVRLEGLEEDWQTQVEPRVRYPALQPGTYRLRARLLHAGLAGPEWAVPLEVMPRWYQTWTFRILAFLLGGSILWGALVLRNWNLRRQNQRLERLVLKRTRELREANERLQELSLTDPLTGLHNRRFLALTLPEQVARIQRDLLPAGGREPELGFLEDHPLVFLVLDIDLFKQVNDEYGHACGDAVLRQLAGVLQSCVRDTDTLIRWGGEEFLVVARQVGSSDPAGLAERIRRAVAERPFELGDGRVIHMTLSIGFSPFPLGNQVPSLPWEKVVLLADRALYAVKRTGRNGWIGLDEGPAFDADILLASGGHPDIPGLLDQSVLHVVSSFPGVPKDAWI